jgi:hypothetical protein
MATALDLIKGALRRINSYQSGEAISALDNQDLLDTLNDLLDSWSTEQNRLFGSMENIVSYTGGKNSYTIGNPKCTDLGQAAFTGTLTNASPTITGVTNRPANLVLGATLADSAGVIPAGTTVTGLGAATVTMSANATATPSTGADNITYTIPGDFGFARPLRITQGFTRIGSLDFAMDVTLSQSRYTDVLYKAQPGPWPVAAWYNPTMPYGTLSVYPTPSASAECHLYTDTILANLTLNQTFILPQGYARALKWCLAQEYCAEFGFPLTESIRVNAAQSLNMIKALNAEPPVVATYDAELTGATANAAWILTGGFR